MRNIVLFFIVLILVTACAEQESVKTVYIDQNGLKITLDSEDTGVIISMAPGYPGAVYYVQISAPHGPIYFQEPIGGDELRFIPLSHGMYSIGVTSERNGVIGGSYRYFTLEPLQKLSLQVEVYFPVQETTGVTFSFTEVSAPTIYVRPSSNHHTVPINGRGTVLYLDVRHDWVTSFAMTTLNIMTGGATVPFTMANCELQDLAGTVIASVPTINVWQTDTHYFTAFYFTGFSYQLAPGNGTTFPIVCDISAGHNYVDFSVSEAYFDYPSFYYVNLGSWANMILAE